MVNLQKLSSLPLLTHKIVGKSIHTGTRYQFLLCADVENINPLPSFYNTLEKLHVILMMCNKFFKKLKKKKLN